MHEISFMIDEKIILSNKVREKLSREFPGYQNLRIKNNIEALTERNLDNLKIDTLFEELNVLRNSKDYNPNLFPELEALYKFYKEKRVVILLDETEEQVFALMKGKRLLSEVPDKIPLKIKIQEIQGSIGLLTFQLGQITQELREKE